MNKPFTVNGSFHWLLFIGDAWHALK